MRERSIFFTGHLFIFHDVTFPETSADELNPFIISHTPMNTSHRPPGIEEISPKPDPIISEIIPQKMITYPTMPHTAIQRGIKVVP